jgi:hypothetical protein
MDKRFFAYYIVYGEDGLQFVFFAVEKFQFRSERHTEYGIYLDFELAFRCGSKILRGGGGCPDRLSWLGL